MPDHPEPLHDELRARKLYEALQSADRYEWATEWDSLSDYWRGVYTRAATSLRASPIPAGGEAEEREELRRKCLHNAMRVTELAQERNALRAELEAARARIDREPMTEEQRDAAFDKASEVFAVSLADRFMQGIDAAERHHGISAPSKEGDAA